MKDDVVVVAFGMMILIEGYEVEGCLEEDEMVGNKTDMVRGEGLCGVLLSVGGESELYGGKTV